MKKRLIYKNIKLHSKYKKNQYKNIEVGNLLFGYSRGEYSVSRELEEYFIEQLSLLGFDAYGKPKKENCFKNSIFEVHSYWWGDCNAPEAKLPNFRYIPTNLEIRWYKYPLRDSYSNRPISRKMLEKIFDECKKSIKKGEN